MSALDDPAYPQPGRKVRGCRSTGNPAASGLAAQFRLVPDAVAGSNADDDPQQPSGVENPGGTGPGEPEPPRQRWGYPAANRQVPFLAFSCSRFSTCLKVATTGY